MKRYLLFAGDDYYPRQAWHDYRGSFGELADALKEAAKLRGNRDWFQIVDTTTERVVEEG